MPEKIFFHIDVNSAFLSWSAVKLLEQGGNVDLRTIPSIVGGDISTRHGIVTAKSIPAKAYGIVTGEPVVSALRKCPTLVSVPPDFQLYSSMSHKMMDFIASVCPEIEQASIDECYMDYTPIADRYESPVACATFIKDSIYERFGFTVNVGISDRKVLAKMASDFRKPNLVHTLYSYEIQEKMWPLPVSDLFMCGKSSVAALRKLGILTIGDLAQADPEILNINMKSAGAMLWSFANGIDDSEITTEHAKAKGVGNSSTSAINITDRPAACKLLLELCESVGSRLRKIRSLAGSITVEIKYSDFTSYSHQMNIPTPTASTDILYEHSCKLFDELWNGEPVRLLGVRTTKLIDEGEPIQLTIFDLETDSRSEKLKKLDSSLDSIRAKYGKDAVQRGSLFSKNKKNSADTEFL